MPRPLPWVLTAVLAAGLTATLVSLWPGREATQALSRRLDALEQENAQLRESMATADRRVGSAGRDLARALTVTPLPPESAAPSRPEPAAREAAEEEENEEAQATEARKRDQRYHARLDLLTSSAPEDAAATARARDLIGAIVGRDGKPGLQIEDARCTASLCRVELRTAGDGGRVPLSTLPMKLGRYWPESTMTPLEDDRTVLYLAANQLPPVNDP